MTTSFTQSLRLWEGQPGDPAIRNIWGTALNENQVLLESAILDTVIVNIAGLTTYALTTANGAADQARPYIQSYQGALTGNCTVTLPNVPKIGWANNATTGGFSVILTTGAGATVTIPPNAFFSWYLVDTAGNVTLPAFTYGALNVSGNALVGGTLGVTGATTLSSTLSVTGNTTLSTATATGNVHLEGTLLVDGATTLSAGAAVTGLLSVTAGVTSSGLDANGANLRFYTDPAGYGAFWRNDGGNAFLLLTNIADVNGTFNAFRPLSVNLATGHVLIDGTNTGTFIGGFNAVKADGGTYNISVSGSSTAAPWAGITGKPYAFNQSTDIGSSPAFGPLTISGKVSASGGIISSGLDANGASLRFYTNAGGYGAVWLNDNSNVYFLLTNNGNALGNINGLRPLAFNVSTGAVSIDATNAGTTIGGAPAVKGDSGTYNISINGNAATASGVAWNNVTSKPYAFNQSTDTGSNPSFGSLNLTGGSVASGSGYNISSSGAQSGPWTVGICLNLGGNFAVGGGFVTFSDARLKSDIKDITPDQGADWVLRGKPKTYSMQGRFTSGFIAQEEIANGRGEAVILVKDDDPQFAESDGIAPAGHKLVRNYTYDVAYLTAALQNALARIEQLEAKIADKA